MNARDDASARFGVDADGGGMVLGGPSPNSCSAGVSPSGGRFAAKQRFGRSVEMSGVCWP